MRSVNTLIRPGKSPGDSQDSLGSQTVSSDAQITNSIQAGKMIERCLDFDDNDAFINIIIIHSNKYYAFN